MNGKLCLLPTDTDRVLLACRTVLVLDLFEIPRFHNKHKSLRKNIKEHVIISLWNRYDLEFAFFLRYIHITAPIINLRLTIDVFYTSDTPREDLNANRCDFNAFTTEKYRLIRGNTAIKSNWMEYNGQSRHNAKNWNLIGANTSKNVHLTYICRWLALSSNTITDEIFV